jgi:coenzyme PQQ precursor peptide PqqA
VSPELGLSRHASRKASSEALSGRARPERMYFDPNEILEWTFMMIPFRGACAARNIGREPRTAVDPCSRGCVVMKWETPEAVDFRFGMEITMYVANR